MPRSDGPVEVWLSQSNLQVTGMIVNEDESTEPLDIESLSLRGAEREATGYLIHRGYTPAGRWETEQREDGVSGPAIEVSRKFAPAKPKAGDRAP